jgi:alanine dehydrogenase
MIVGVPRETFPGERRVALVPAVLPTLAKPLPFSPPPIKW